MPDLVAPRDLPTQAHRLLIGHPSLGHEPACIHASEDRGIDDARLDPRLDNEMHLPRVGDDEPANERRNRLRNYLRIAGHLDNAMVLVRQLRGRQGATQSMEDAVILAKTICEGSTLDAAFSQFEAERRPRAERTVREARTIGNLAHCPDWVAFASNGNKATCACNVDPANRLAIRRSKTRCRTRLIVPCGSRYEEDLMSN